MLKNSLISLSTATVFNLGLMSASPARAATFLSFDSEPGDYIGQGESAFFDRNDGYFRVGQNYNNGNTISVDFYDYYLGGDNSWSLSLAAPNNTPLIAGSYEGATRFPFQNPSQPGLDFTGNGRGCNTSTGRFNVQEITYDAYNELSRFKANFEQHCEGAEPALFGQVEFDRSEFDADNLAKLQALTNKIQNYDTALYYFSEPGDYIGGGLEEILTPKEVDFSVTNFDNHVGFSLNNFSTSQDPIWWSLNFAAPENNTLVPGSYDRATRYPFQSPQRSGLDFSGNGRGCNQLGGRFQVLEATYNSQGEIEQFDALFEQHCEDELAIGPAVYGRIRYNASSPSQSVPEPGTVFGIIVFGGWLVSQGKLKK